MVRDLVTEWWRLGHAPGADDRHASPNRSDQSVTVEGWYLRATGRWTRLSLIETDDGSITGFVHLGGLVSAGTVLLLGLVVPAVPLVV